MPDIVWKGLETQSIEHCTVSESADGVRVSGRIEQSPDRCTYELFATTAWQFRSLTIRAGASELTAERADNGQWLVNGTPRPDLVDAREVDISASPFSNTLPIRRLGLDIGHGADITTAYIVVPDPTVTTDPQRYTRLSAREYLYESRDSDFCRTITVDDAGLVVDYPGLFEREAPIA